MISTQYKLMEIFAHPILFLDRLFNYILIYIDKKYFSTNSDYHNVNTIEYFLENENKMHLPSEVYLNEFNQIKIENHNYSNLRIPDIFNADLSIQLLCYALIRNRTPETIIETGVGNGLSSAIILNAIYKNNKGTLISIDLPPFGRISKVGNLIPDKLKSPWKLVYGSSFRRLNPLLMKLSKVDFFLHDSANIYHVQKYELITIYSKIKEAGIMVVNNISQNNAFIEFCEKYKPSRYYIIKQVNKINHLTGIIIK